MIRIGFWGPLYYNCNNSIGNYLGHYIIEIWGGSSVGADVIERGSMIEVSACTTTRGHSEGSFLQDSGMSVGMQNKRKHKP